MMLIKVIIVLILFVSLVVFAIGGVIWMFVQQHLEFKRYLKWLEHLDKLKKEDKWRR